MTKEKPIGLIVGLFFIIVFGLILSELTGTNAACPPPPSAEEEHVGAYNPTPTIDDYVPYNPAPLGPPTGGGLGADALVDVHMTRPGADDRGGVIEAEIRPDAALLAATQALPTGVVDSYMPEASVPAPVAARTTDGTIYVGPGGVSSEHLVGPAAAVQAQTKTYIVESGDTLTRIARKFYGAGHEGEYKRIFAANRDSMRTESSLSIGQELTIPPLSLDNGATSDRSASGTTDAGQGGRSGNGRYVAVSLGDLPGALSGINRRPEPVPAPAPARTYVVQRGDSLTSIARRLMRDDSSAAVRKLFEANRGILPSRDRLQIGMELRLPG